MAQEVPRMSKVELRERLHDVVLLDVRSPKDWDRSEWKIKGSRREIPTEENRWMERHPKDRTYVLYCGSPNENTSAGSARKLMEAGYSSVYALKGGWNEWREAQYPMEKK